VKSFIQLLAQVVFGVLSGFDRLMFQGHLRRLAFPGGMNYYCNVNGVRLTAFARHAEQVTEQLITASEAEAKRWHRPIEYLASFGAETAGRRLGARPLRGRSVERFGAAARRGPEQASGRGQLHQDVR
jgi:hypothetical protein